MPTKLPEAVEKQAEALRDPATPYDHVEHGGWLVTRLWESDDEFEVVAALVVTKFEALPPPKHNDRPIHRRWRTRST